MRYRFRVWIHMHVRGPASAYLNKLGVTAQRAAQPEATPQPQPVAVDR